MEIGPGAWQAARPIIDTKRAALFISRSLFWLHLRVAAFRQSGKGQHRHTAKKIVQSIRPGRKVNKPAINTPPVEALVMPLAGSPDLLA
jgi:hypothetical protein